MSNEWYPSVICEECASAAKGHTAVLVHGVATFYETECDVCLELKICTEPRDYGHFEGASYDVLVDIHDTAVKERKL